LRTDQFFTGDWIFFKDKEEQFFSRLGIYAWFIFPARKQLRKLDEVLSEFFRCLVENILK